jgi:DNA-binding response OmpR family regulator
MIPTRVLVIEDEVDLQEELVDYLVARGYRAEGVASLAEMHAALDADPGWQVLVLDLRLPDGDGLDGGANRATEAWAGGRHHHGHGA